MELKKLKYIKKKGGNAFIAENIIYGKIIHLLKCPVCGQTDCTRIIPSSECIKCGYKTNKLKA